MEELDGGPVEVTGWRGLGTKEKIVQQEMFWMIHGGNGHYHKHGYTTSSQEGMVRSECPPRSGWGSERSVDASHAARSGPREAESTASPHPSQLGASRLEGQSPWTWLNRQKQGR